LEPRDVPESFAPRQRQEFLEISNRCKVELNATFATVAIGLQLYLESARLAEHRHANGTDNTPH